VLAAGDLEAGVPGLADGHLAGVLERGDLLEAGVDVPVPVAVEVLDVDPDGGPAPGLEELLVLQPVEGAGEGEPVGLAVGPGADEFRLGDVLEVKPAGALVVADLPEVVAVEHAVRAQGEAVGGRLLRADRLPAAPAGLLDGDVEAV